MLADGQKPFFFSRLTNKKADESKTRIIRKNRKRRDQRFWKNLILRQLQQWVPCLTASSPMHSGYLLVVFFCFYFQRHKNSIKINFTTYRHFGKLWNTITTWTKQTPLYMDHHFTYHHHYTWTKTNITSCWPLSGLWHHRWMLRYYSDEHILCWTVAL